MYIYHISANSVAINTFYIQKKSKELYMPAKFCVQNICKSLSKCGRYTVKWGDLWTYFWYIS